MQVRTLPFKRENIKKRPDLFMTTISQKPLIFRISYNPVADAFFFDLFSRDGEVIIAGRRIVYFQDMLSNISNKQFDFSLIPADKSGQMDDIGITVDNFGKEVKVYIIDHDNNG